MNKEKVWRKVIITAAVTGAGSTPSMSEYLPVTPRQIADDAVRAYEAGAAIVHIHARNPETGEPTARLEVFREILTKIKSRCDVVICVSTGDYDGKFSPGERIAVVSGFKPELASLNCGSLNGGGATILAWERFKDRLKYQWEHEHLRKDDFVFQNTIKMMREFSQVDRDNSTKPELEIWDTGQIHTLKFMLDQGHIDRPVHVQFVMGGLSGMPATAGMLTFVYDEARRVLGDFTWSVAAIGRDQIPIAAIALAIGGNVRVGMEDSLFAGYGRLAQGSADQVERVATIARQLSIEPATPSEARQMLGLKGPDRVNF